MLNYDNEIGTPQKPPKLLNVNNYSNWKARFEHYISYTDSSIWIPILEGYKYPTHIYLDDEFHKPISKLDEEEKKAYDREKKALGSITMALTRELFHSFQRYDNSKDLWKALQKRFKGNSDIKKSKRDLLRKQYECFRFFENEYLDDLISRFYPLQTELEAFELKYPAEEMVEKFLDALPPKFEMYTTLMRENPKFYELTVEEAIGKVQAHDMNLRRKESSGRPHIQDPSMYHGTTSTSKSSGSGIALFTGNPTEEDHSTGCGGHACYASGSGLGSHHQNTSRNPPATSSANNSAIARIAEDHVALFSSCMLAYENFIGGKLTDPETIEEGFNQVDPDDMEDMDIQWNMAMLLRRAKHTAPASGFTRPSLGNNHGQNNPNHHNQSQGGKSNALVAQQDDNFDWGVHLEDAIITQTQVGLMAEIMEMMEAERREASMADLKESTTAATEEEEEAEGKEASVAEKEESTTTVALMAIGEATSSSHELHLDIAYKGLEKRNNEINKLQNEILQLKCSNEKLKNSRFVVEHYESVVR
ncbi:hypothetical protein L1987_13346 [Smallanthus sonchifolius]|uniref:Uncharacterized protein n=1 Tax=Smallanthus sonchifolius TaxID=185202 RepID=A0ACB9JIE5_9ASTR|nr:hypothetical protein L1987_13346 [Smallanthus sonchifolius]